MALDVGSKRIGIAISDPSRLLASPLITITRNSKKADIETILNLACENDIKDIVVGLPISLSGKFGPQAKQITAFIEKLSEQTTLPVTFIDERYSTTEAKKLLIQAGAKISDNKGRVDSAAAAIILQSFLDSNKTVWLR